VAVPNPSNLQQTMNTANTAQSIACQQCSAPARESDIDLAEAFPILRLPILCEKCGQQEEHAEQQREKCCRKKGINTILGKNGY